MQSSGGSDTTCFVRVETNVKRYRSCCSEGRACSFLMSSSGLRDSRRGGGGSLVPLRELGRGVEDIARRI